MSQPIQHPLILAERVTGAQVFGTDGDKLGRIEDIAVDKVSGRVVYAILSFGGVLGMGERYFPLPWALLKYDTDERGYVVPVVKDSLTDAPSFEPTELGGWNDTHMRQSIFDYYAAYGATPYWI